MEENKGSGRRMPNVAYSIMVDASSKPVVWVGASLQDLRSFPREAQRTLGYALRFAQQGGKHPDAKPLKGFGGAGVLEVVVDYDGDTYRLVYTVRLQERIYVLHAFQKKARQGISTPKHEIDLIRSRLKQAEEIHRRWTESKKKGKP